MLGVQDQGGLRSCFAFIPYDLRFVSHFANIILLEPNGCVTRVQPGGLYGLARENDGLFFV